MILAAETPIVLPTTFDWATAGVVLGVIYTVVKLLDRMYLQPRLEKTKVCSTQQQTPQCTIDHALLKEGQKRVEAAVAVTNENLAHMSDVLRQMCELQKEHLENQKKAG